MYQDIIQFHLINKIENLEYNYDFVSLLLREYQQHDTLFSYNKLQTSEAISIILQLFMGFVEYITFIEEMRVQGRYDPK